MQRHEMEQRSTVYLSSFQTGFVRKAKYRPVRRAFVCLFSLSLEEKRPPKLAPFVLNVSENISSTTTIVNMYVTKQWPPCCPQNEKSKTRKDGVYATREDKKSPNSNLAFWNP
jgi:hypothetical protein